MLFWFGLVFVAISTAYYFFGAQQQPLHLPEMLFNQFHLPDGLDVGVHRPFRFLIVVGLLLVAGLQWMIAGARFGAKLRASVNNSCAARDMDDSAAHRVVHHRAAVSSLHRPQISQ